MRLQIKYIGAALLLVAFPTEARPQAGYGYYPGYGAYGWGGWGGTVQGNIARGLGYFARAAGVFNRETAVARAINADTVLRWNEYWYRAQQEANRRAHLRREREQERISRLGEEVQTRLREDPTQHDIETGDALNVLLDEVTDPAISRASLQSATEVVSGDAIRAIPFFHAPQAATINLAQLTAESGWPAALRGPEAAADRDAYREAVEAAVEQAVDREESITPDTLRAMRSALSRLRSKLEAAPPADPVEASRARDYMRALAGMTRMLERPRFEKVVGELGEAKQTTLGHLLAFMQTYNLRFGRAETPRQRTVYRELYPKLTALRERVSGQGRRGERAWGEAAGTNDAADFFRGMTLEDLEGDAESKDARG